MSDKDKIDGIKGKKKSSGVKGIEDASKVRETEEVSGVGEVQKTGKVGKVQGAGAAGDSGGNQKITRARLEELQKITEEEVKKLVSQGILPKEKAQIAKEAVDMVLDSAAVEDDE